MLQLEHRDDATYALTAEWVLPPNLPLIPVALRAGVASSKWSTPVIANAGRWVVPCPDCGSGQFGCPDDRRFMCHECFNGVVSGHLWRPVVWPKNAEAIDDELCERPRKNQNWLPGETLGDLKAEMKVALTAAVGGA